jgi:hypothetical protein
MIKLGYNVLGCESVEKGYTTISLESKLCAKKKKKKSVLDREAVITL